MRDDEQQKNDSTDNKTERANMLALLDSMSPFTSASSEVVENDLYKCLAGLLDYILK